MGYQKKKENENNNTYVMTPLFIYNSYNTHFLFLT